MTIDLGRVSDDEWIAYDSDDGEGVIGRGETGPRAAEDYCRRVAEHLEDQGGPCRGLATEGSYTTRTIIIYYVPDF